MPGLCPLCGSAPRSIASHPKADARTIDCPVCGTFDIDGVALSAFRFDKYKPSPDRRYLLSAFAKTAPLHSGAPVHIKLDTFKKLEEDGFREKTFTEKRDALLDWLAFLSRQNLRSPYGADVPLNPATDYPAAFCHDLRDGNWNEWNFIFKPLLDRGLIIDVGNGLVRITDAGWQRLETATKASGAQGFIAMAFRDMDHVDLAIQTAITSAGYRPCRIDREEYLGGVMDEILARIRQSRFVVADLTHNRGGVYYEAGFALGLGIPVIPTCRIDHVDGSAPNLRVHFDVQHINLLTWEESKLDVLTAKLSARIVALFGVGPLSPRVF